MVFKRTLLLLFTLVLATLCSFSQSKQWSMELRGQVFLTLAKGNFSHDCLEDTLNGRKTLRLRLIYDSSFYREMGYPDTTKLARLLLTYSNAFGYLMIGDDTQHCPAYDFEFFEQLSPGQMQLRYGGVSVPSPNRQQKKLTYKQRMYLLKDIIPLDCSDDLYADSLVVRLVPWRHTRSILADAHPHESVHEYLSMLGYVLVDQILEKKVNEIHLCYTDPDNEEEPHFLIIRPDSYEFKYQHDRFTRQTGKQ